LTFEVVWDFAVGIPNFEEAAGNRLWAIRGGMIRAIRISCEATAVERPGKVRDPGVLGRFAAGEKRRELILLGGKDLTIFPPRHYPDLPAGGLALSAPPGWGAPFLRSSREMESREFRAFVIVEISRSGPIANRGGCAAADFGGVSDWRDTAPMDVCQLFLSWAAPAGAEPL
jgi:hypothetical protein